MTLPETRRVVVKLFAGAKQAVGAAEIALDLPSGSTVGQLRDQLAEQAPGLAPLMKRALLAVNCEFASDAQPVPADAELALIPPVSGG